MKVRIEEVPAMPVASCRAVGVSPEVEVWTRLKTWAEAAGLLVDPEKHPVFALYRHAHHYDPEHGCELWIGMDWEIPPPEGMEQKEFAGGLYAVTEWSAGPGGLVGPKWEELEGWVQMSDFGFGEHQRLERILGLGEEAARRELYLPIVR